MVFDHQHEHPSQWKAICAIGEQLGVHRESLRNWVRVAEVDAGRRGGVSSEERDRIKALERENRELRRANEILKEAAVFFATELDGVAVCLPIVAAAEGVATAADVTGIIAGTVEMSVAAQTSDPCEHYRNGALNVGLGTIGLTVPAAIEPFTQTAGSRAALAAGCAYWDLLSWVIGESTSC